MGGWHQELTSNTLAGVRIASCCCLRSLSRSVHILRTWIADAEVAPPLCALLGDPRSYPPVGFIVK